MRWRCAGWPAGAACWWARRSTPPCSPPRRAPTVLPVLADGTLDLAALDAALAGPPALVCLMAANNETGVLHPLAEAAALCRAAGALLHVDAVQAAGRVPVALERRRLPGALGPQAGRAEGGGGAAAAAGAGAGAAGRRRRAGTRPARRDRTAARHRRHGRGAGGDRPRAAARLAALRDAIEAAHRRAGAEGVAGAGAPRLPNTTSLMLPGVPAETQVIALDLAGVRVSAGAACSSGKVARSHVLAAMGLGRGGGLRDPRLAALERAGGRGGAVRRGLGGDAGEAGEGRGERLGCWPRCAGRLPWAMTESRSARR